MHGMMAYGMVECPSRVADRCYIPFSPSLVSSPLLFICAEFFPVTVIWMWIEQLSTLAYLNVCIRFFIVSLSCTLEPFSRIPFLPSSPLTPPPRSPARQWAR